MRYTIAQIDRNHGEYRIIRGINKFYNPLLYLNSCNARLYEYMRRY